MSGATPAVLMAVAKNAARHLIEANQHAAQFVLLNDR
jgi:hypothetical protein